MRTKPASRSAAAIAIAIAMLVTACAGPAAVPSLTPSAPPQSAAPTPGDAPSPTIEPTPSGPPLPASVDIEEAGALAIDATRDTDWIVLVEGRAWVSGVGDGIGIFDSTGALEGSLAVSGWCESMDVGFGAVWSASCDPPGLIRFDVATREVTRVTFPEPIVDSEASVGAGEGAVWLVAGESSDVLIGVDPESLEVAHRYPVPPGSAAVRAAFGAIWVTRPRDDELLRVDPASGEVVATIEVGETPVFLAVGAEAVWVMNQAEGSVSRVDPATNAVVATIPTGLSIRGGDIAVGGGAVWVRGGPELLARIDPATNEVTDKWGPLAGSGSVAADDAAVWVTAHDVERIWRLPLD